MYGFENTLQKHPTSASSGLRLHHVFTLIKSDFYFLVGASEQALAFLAMNHELIAFDINFMHLTGWLIHSLVPTPPQRCFYKSVRRKQERLSTLSVCPAYVSWHPLPSYFSKPCCASLNLCMPPPPTTIQTGSCKHVDVNRSYQLPQNDVMAFPYLTAFFPKQFGTFCFPTTADS